MPSGKDIQAGRAGVQIFGDESRLIRTLRSTERRLNAFAAKTARIGATLFGAGAAGMALFKPTLDAAGRTETELAKFKAVFGELSDEATAFAEHFGHRLNRRVQDVQTGLSTFQAFFKGLDFDNPTAADFSARLQTLKTDFAAFHGISDTEGLERFISALSGSAEVLDRFGINLKASALDQELLRQGIRETTATATENQKVLARIALIENSLRSQNAIGSAAAKAGSYKTEVAAAAGATEDLKAEIGTGLLPTMAGLFGQYTAATRAARVWVRENPGIVRGAALAATGLAASGVALLAFAGTVKLTAIGLGVTATALKLFGTGLAFLATPLGITTAALAALAITAQIKFGLFTRAMNALSPAIATVKRDTIAAFGGIRDALAANDLGLAARIGWGFVELEWSKGTAALDTLFNTWSQDALRAWGETYAGVELIAGSALRRVWQGTKEATDLLLDLADLGVLNVGTDAMAQAAADRLRKRQRATLEDRAAADAAALAAQAKAGKALSDLASKQAAERLKAEAAAADKVAKAQADFEALIGEAKAKAAKEAEQKQPDGSGGGTDGSGAGTPKSGQVFKAGTVQSGIASRLAFAFALGKPTTNKVVDKANGETEAVDTQTDALDRNAAAWKRRRSAQELAADIVVPFRPQTPDRPDATPTARDFAQATAIEFKPPPAPTPDLLPSQRAELNQAADRQRSRRVDRAREAAGIPRDFRPHVDDGIGRAERILQQLEAERASGRGNAVLTNQGDLRNIVRFAQANRRFAGQPESTTVTPQNAVIDIQLLADKLDNVKAAIEAAAPRYR